MTRIEKSESQNIAEAAAPLEERDLDAAIAAHRVLYAADLGILRLHVRDGESGIGPPFNPVFEAFLDGRLGQFPWSRAFFSLRYRFCRTHSKHRGPPEWGGALCATLTSLVIRHEYSLDRARMKLGLPNEGKSRRTLDNALLYIEGYLNRLADYEARDHQAAVERTPAEWMRPEHEHHPVPGLHQLECAQCLRRRVA